MYPAVKTVVPHEDYTLGLTFDNGEEGVLDMHPYLRIGVFQRIAEYAQFSAVRVSFDTIEWECGADLDPELVYAYCKKTANL